MARREDWADCVATTSPWPTFFLSLMMHVTWTWLNFLCFSFNGCCWCSLLGMCPRDKTAGEQIVLSKLCNAWASYRCPELREDCGVSLWVSGENLHLREKSGMPWPQGAEPSIDHESWCCCLWYRKEYSWFRESKRERALEHVYLFKAPWMLWQYFHWIILKPAIVFITFLCNPQLFIYSFSQYLLRTYCVPGNLVFRANNGEIVNSDNKS